jgi:diaminohydroxyphosphoribosylaminopyrimidine deaminase/5-amino-6-(5-phosphoribosylamino)uracil reductase
LGRPYIILKWAASADGFIAPTDGSQVQLSNTFSHTLVHQWRTEEAAIMVGYNTALGDNPQLTARSWQGPQPLRVVLDRRLKLPSTHHLLDNTTPTWIINEREDRLDGNTEYVRSGFDGNMLHTLLARLGAHKKISLFVEGGAALLNSFIEAGLWDEARVFTTVPVLGNGIAAPILRESQLSLSTSVGTDTLNLYQRKGTKYPYPAGALL